MWVRSARSGSRIRAPAGNCNASYGKVTMYLRTCVYAKQTSPAFRIQRRLPFAALPEERYRLVFVPPCKQSSGRERYCAITTTTLPEKIAFVSIIARAHATCFRRWIVISCRVETQTGNATSVTKSRPYSINNAKLHRVSGTFVV